MILNNRIMQISFLEINKESIINMYNKFPYLIAATLKVCMCRFKYGV